MNRYLSMLQRFAASILPLCSAGTVAKAQAEQPLSLTELLSILPGDCDTYHLPLIRGTSVNIDVLADDHLEISLVRYPDIGATSRSETYSHRAIAKATQFVFTCPQTGDYLLQFLNNSLSTTNAIVSISSQLVVLERRLPQTVDATPLPDPLFDEATSVLSLARWFQSRP